MYLAPLPPPEKKNYITIVFDLLGQLWYPKEIENNDDAKFGAGGGGVSGVNKVHYGVCENVTVGNDQSRRA